MSKPDRRRPRPALVAAGLALLLAPLAPIAGIGRAAPEDEVAAVRRLLDRQVEDWNREDLDAFLEGYWHAPGVVFQSDSDRHDGFEAMRDRYVKRYRSEGRAMGKLAFGRVEVIPLGPDAMLARGRWGLKMPDGQEPGGLFTLILRKRPEGWKIVHDHTSS